MFLTSALNLLYDSALAIFYPQPCAVCGLSVESRFDGIACRDCWLSTFVFSGLEALCWKCGAPLLGITEVDESRRCGRCDDDMFTVARSCGIYEKSLRAVVLSLKEEPNIPPRVKEILGEAAKRAPLDHGTRIVPVPLHPERERARGFNQAEVI